MESPGVDTDNKLDEDITHDFFVMAISVPQAKKRRNTLSIN